MACLARRTTLLPSAAASAIASAMIMAALAMAVAAAPHERTNHTTAVTTTARGFTFRSMPTDRYAAPLPSPLTQPQYAPHYAQAKTLLPADVTYTTYALATATPTPNDNDRYGQSAYNAMWSGTTYASALPFTTVVTAATPLPSSELVYPPPLPARAASPANGLKFPKDFIWGVAGSAWQSEGGLQFGGRGPSSIDLTGTTKNADANVADMHYFLYRQDIARLAALGVPTYSFSISWPRVVPFGVANSPINEEALAHYDDVINACVEYGVTPVVTMFHFDSPVGVLSNLTALPDTFLYYAQQVMARYGDRVPVWITMNEPNLLGFFLPELDYNLYAALLRAHAKVYRWYKDVLKGTGLVTFKLANLASVPLDTSNPDDVAAALRAQEFSVGIMSRPVFLGEQIPSVVLTTPGLAISPLSADDLALVHGTADFYAVDAYVAQFASAPPAGYAACAANKSDPLWPSCAVQGNVQKNGWLMGPASNAYPMIAPQYVREQIGYVWETYRPAGGVMVTEFGFPVAADELLRAVHHDGVKLIGALAWSVLDNNEFGSYADQYGLQYVNRSSPGLERRFKRSFFDIVDFFHEHVEK
ncbi:beta-glucosidase [Zopfochytrium polystomum]|nr:beta-glucosidase [Zopfochytrium polystomum]